MARGGCEEVLGKVSGKVSVGRGVGEVSIGVRECGEVGGECGYTYQVSVRDVR